ncbi:Rieske 2Fe-2S domain-containing protein [Streptomyces sp. PTM05]|uniref:Rieske 2Fe-2S domain-containing protein n=1 Tax=Streptantibioticus parmotrematis TaxID=2873249 RepID=A0ABS7QVR2_9ACTN|nr:Rieske 2Fe-2S domain-containing protein [Streptantibioticus parmotrematis]
MAISDEAHTNTPGCRIVPPPVRFLSRPIPAEGEDGVFTQSWFPICRSSEVGIGKLTPRPFLDGKVIVFRDTEGVAQVLSGYCTHLGADLSRAEVVDSTVRCPLHRWRWDKQGLCVATGTGLLDDPPRNARIFSFPTTERFGLVWAFNGIEPLWEIPSMSSSDDALVWHVGELGVDMHIDPFVFCANGMDIQHLEALHGVQFDPADLVDDRNFLYEKYRAQIKLRNEFRGELMETVWSTWGTSFFTLEGEIDGRWFAIIDGLALPAPGLTQAFIVGLAERTDDAEADARQALKAFEWERSVLLEDIEVLADLHFRPGPVTRSDTHVARFYEYLRKYPRAHPSRDFIN